MNNVEETVAPAVEDVTPEAQNTEAEFSLSASESELLEEFGVLLAAEYSYGL